MRPAVLLFALLLILPILACESGLTEPLPDDPVTELTQPLSVEPLFAKGQQDQTQDMVQEALKNQDGSCQDATATAEADTEEQQAAGTRNRKGMQESAEAAEGEDALLGQRTKTQARTKKGDGSPSAFEEEAVKAKRQTRSKYGPK